MSEEPGDVRISRRGFVGACGVGVVIGATAGVATAQKPAAGIAMTSAGPAVLSVHQDQAWHDFGGKGEPYLPPAGARSTDAIAHLDDEGVARLQYSI